MRAVVLAGGKGTRLHPYTAILPKPLMPVGDKSVLEVIVRQLKSCGVKHITISLGHLAHLVKAVLGNGDNLETKIDYTIEDSPMGTCGSLSLVHELTGPFLVVNGDVLTNLDFGKLMQFHMSQSAAVTIAAYKRSVSINYGVLKRSGHVLEDYNEKPALNYEVSMGVYVFDPCVLKYIPCKTFMDFPDVIKTLLASGKTVSIYPFDGIWYDLGRQEDFVEVLDQLNELKKCVSFL
jgi:NDP-mannose synthase